MNMLTGVLYPRRGPQPGGRRQDRGLVLPRHAVPDEPLDREVTSWSKGNVRPGRYFRIAPTRGGSSGSSRSGAWDKDDFAEGLSGEHAFLSLTGVGQGKDRIHDRFEFPVFDEPADVQQFGAGAHVGSHDR